EPPAGHPRDQPFGTCHLVHVEDLAQATVAAAASDHAGLRAYLLSDPHPSSWQDYYRRHAQMLGEGTVRMVPHEELRARLPPPAPASQGPGLAAQVSSALRAV